MQLSMLDELDRYSLRRVLSSDADHVAHRRPSVNTPPLACVATRESRENPARTYASGRMLTPGLQFDDVEKRWRRLEALPRERRCSFRCSTDSIATASAAFYRLTQITSLTVGRP